MKRLLNVQAVWSKDAVDLQCHHYIAIYIAWWLVCNSSVENTAYWVCIRAQLDTRMPVGLFFTWK
jgi:hypothetical protein